MIFRGLIQHRPPAWIAKIEARLLKHACVQAATQMGVKLPKPQTRSALAQFEETTLALAAITAGQPDLRQQLKLALGKQAEKLGRMAKHALCVSEEDAFDTLRFLYQGIGIDLSGDLPGYLQFNDCYFSGSYSPDTCDLMSAMDEGVMRGLAGSGNLVFRQRITEGCKNCHACFLERSLYE